jgi:hypothetical protein
MTLADCKHENIHFDAKSGSFYLRCAHCPASWMAIDPVDDSPRYEALRESYGLTEDRRAVFYTPAYYQAHQLQNALHCLKITPNPKDPTHLYVNIDQALTLLYLRPQAEVLRRFEDTVRSKYVHKPITEANKRAILADAKDFIKGVARTHVPR